MILHADDVQKLMALFHQRMLENRDWLIELDASMGDGDLGLTMSAGFAKAAEVVQAETGATPGQMLVKAGSAIANAAPSTMGTLIASGLMAAGKVVQDVPELHPRDVSAMFEAFGRALMTRGKARPGQKTVVDAIVPAAEALAGALSEGEDLTASLAKAAEAAERGMLATKGLTAVHGRAAFYREASLGRQDPGATVGWLLVKAVSDYVRMTARR